MHFSTISGAEGDTALLESRLLYPNRNYQCLQFFYYHSGSPNDKLEIWVREYSEANPNGKLRMIQTVPGELGSKARRTGWLAHQILMFIKTC